MATKASKSILPVSSENIVTQSGKKTQSWKLTAFIELVTGLIQLGRIDLLAQRVEDGGKLGRFDESGFALVEHDKSLLQHCDGQKFN